MYTFFVEGGWSMFVILAFGLVALATAGVQAARPAKSRERFLKGMSRAVLWATLAGLLSDLGATFHYAPRIVDDSERSRTIAQGIAESMGPGVMGFAMLAIVAFLTAVGQRRLDAQAG